MLHDAKHMVIVYFQYGGINQDVIEVYNHKVIKPVVKQRIHCSLECSWEHWSVQNGITRNSYVPYREVNAVLGFITMANGDLVVATIKVKFSKPFSIVQGGQADHQCIASGKLFFSVDFIQSMIINAYTHRSIFLANE